MYKQRTILFYKDYFEEFFVKQSSKVRNKIIWTFQLIEELERIPSTYLKHIENTDGFLKSESSKEAIYLESFVFSIMANWWF